MENTKVAAVVTDMLNSYSTKERDQFLQDMQREHRTLQQSFTKLCMMWLEICAGDTYRHDLRNEASHEVSKELIDTWKESKSNDRYLSGANPSQLLPTI